MAIVTTTVVPVLRIFNWSGATGQGKASAPIGQLIASARDAAVALTGVGDSQQVNCNVTLPDNYTYVLTDASAGIDIAGLPAAINWDVLGTCIYFPPADEPDNATYGLTWASDGAVQGPGVFSNQQYEMNARYPKFQLQPGALFQSSFHNVTTNDIGAGFNFHLRFLIFTIAQEFDSRVNTPELIR